jgi:hypothetical protein
MRNKPERTSARSYRVIATVDGTFTVEVSDGTNVIMKKRGFLNKGTADAWIADQERVLKAKPPS